jgi:hypothetical protein
LFFWAKKRAATNGPPLFSISNYLVPVMVPIPVMIAVLVTISAYLMPFFVRAMAVIVPIPRSGVRSAAIIGIVIISRAVISVVIIPLVP